MKNVSLQPGEGRSYWMLGGLYTVKASSDETGGALSVMEMLMPEGGGPPPHIHNCSESVYVMEGAIRLHMDGEVTVYGPGSFFHIPAGTLEQPEPVGTARVLITYAPGGMDEFFAEAGEPAGENVLPPPPTEPPDLERLTAIAARHGLEMRMPS
jgi:mannose-6-phosphate isomerase-like protein (cupin superfamily)